MHGNVRLFSKRDCHRRNPMILHRYQSLADCENNTTVRAHTKILGATCFFLALKKEPNKIQFRIICGTVATDGRKQNNGGLPITRSTSRLMTTSSTATTTVTSAMRTTTIPAGWSSSGCAQEKRSSGYCVGTPLRYCSDRCQPPIILPIS